MDPLEPVTSWPVDNVAAAVLGPDGDVHTVGDVHRVFALASVTKLLTAATVQIAHDEGTVDLDRPVPGLDGATGCDLLAHSSGLGAEDGDHRSRPHQRRIYSNHGYEMIAALVQQGAGFDFATYLSEAVLHPLAMTSSALSGSAAAGATASLSDLIGFVGALRDGRLLSPAAMGRFTTPHRPELDGVLPGYGRRQPNPWGQGPEIRGAKSPHWTGTANSGRTWGHFGQTGTLVWHDPVPSTSLIVLTDRPFGPWAIPVWPRLADHVLSSVGAPRS